MEYKITENNDIGWLPDDWQKSVVLSRPPLPIPTANATNNKTNNMTVPPPPHSHCINERNDKDSVGCCFFQELQFAKFNISYQKI